MEIRFGEGICRRGDLLEKAITLGLAKRSGSWISWGDTRLQGRDAWRDHLADKPEMYSELDAGVLGELGVGPGVVPAEA